MKLKLKEMILVALFTALMTVGAFVKIPFPYVPVTFQPFFCAFAGILLGSRLGALSQAIYVAMGLLGLPVFSQGGGLGYVLKPSFGYLIGFVCAAFIIGKISEKLNELSLTNALVSLMAGLAAIYLIGIPYTYLILKFYMNKPDALLISGAIIPYILKDFVLYIIVAVTVARMAPVLRRAGLVKA